MILSDATMDKDIDNHLMKKCVWKNHSLWVTTKVQEYRPMVLTTVLYGSEALVMYRK